jgi:hypothetical protein
VVVSPVAIWQPPPREDPPGTATSLSAGPAAPESIPPSDTAGIGVVPLATPPKHAPGTRRSELGGMQAIVHPASTKSAGSSTPHVAVWHPHDQVEGQSESTVHGPVCCAKHSFHVV